MEGNQQLVEICLESGKEQEEVILTSNAEYLNSSFNVSGSRGGQMGHSRYRSRVCVQHTQC